VAPQKKFLTSLCQICENVVSATDYNEALFSLVKNATKCLKTKASSIRLLDRTGNTLEIVASFGLSQWYLKKGPVEVDKSPLDKLVLSGKIVQIKDVTKDKRFQYPREAKKEGIKSVLCLPLKVRKRWLGILRIYTGKERVFGEEEISFISTLASQGAVVINNAQRYQRLKRLYEIGKTITSHLEIEKVLYIICQNAAADISAKGSSILLINKETGELEYAATYGLSEQFIRKGPIKGDRSITECLKGKEVIIEDACRDERIQYPEAVRQEGIKSIICIPLKVKEKVTGTLRIYTAYQYKLLPEDVEFLNILADFGAIAIENARLYQHVKIEYEELAKSVWEWYSWGERQPRI